MRGVLPSFLLVAMLAAFSVAQDAGAQDAGHATDMSGQHSSDQHRPDMPGMNMGAEKLSFLPSPHAGSGTGWQPASVPAHQWMTKAGGWA